MRRNIVPLKRGDARHTLLVRLGVRRRARAVLADTLRAALPIRLFAPARGIQHLGMVRIALLDRSEVANPRGGVQRQQRKHFQHEHARFVYGVYRRAGNVGCRKKNYFEIKIKAPRGRNFSAARRF